MSAALEAFLARIYVDREARHRFLRDPRGEALGAGLSPDEATDLEVIDRVGLELAADSYSTKRAQRHTSRNRRTPWGH